MLAANKFVGSGKDFSWHIRILESLGMKPGMKMLEYGANWGYATWQFKNAGFDVDAYEISVPRAQYGNKLDVFIETDISKITGQYDLIYSCHVLEHVPNPKDVLLWQMSRLRPGGLLVAHTPNGSLRYRQDHHAGFHRIWGQVHPVLLTDNFVSELFKGYPLYITSDDRPELLERWDRSSRVINSCDDAGLFFVVRKHHHILHQAES